MPAFPWKEQLARWSQEIIELGEYDIESGWLGVPGATEEEIATAEARLGTTLPPSYRAFLKVTNGWRTTIGFAGRLRPVEEVGWLADEAQELIDAWVMGEQWLGGDLPAIPDEEYLVYGESAIQPLRSEYLQTALALSDDRDGMILLNPRTVAPDGEWEAWFFAPWVPGADRYRSFWELMQAQHKRRVYVVKRERGEPTPHADPSLGVDARDLDGLLAALQNPEQRLAALEALANLRDRRAFEPVLAIFQDPAQDLFVREHAARTLGRLRDPRAVQPLLDAFRATPEEMSGLKLGRLLGKTGDTALSGLLDQLSIEDVLGQLDRVFGPAMADPLRATLAPAAVGQGLVEHLNHAVRQGLLELGQAALPALFDALGDPDPRVRREVASVLCYARRRQGVLEHLLPAFADPDPGVRAAVATHIEQLFDPRVVDPLLQALQDAEGQVRASAARSLGAAGRYAGEERIALALAAVADQDPDPQVQRIARQSLGNLERRR
jgi:HEAT repeat protein